MRTILQSKPSTSVCTKVAACTSTSFTINPTTTTHYHTTHTHHRHHHNHQHPTHTHARVRSETHPTAKQAFNESGRRNKTIRLCIVPSGDAGSAKARRGADAEGPPRRDALCCAAFPPSTQHANTHCTKLCCTTPHVVVASCSRSAKLCSTELCCTTECAPGCCWLLLASAGYCFLLLQNPLVPPPLLSGPPRIVAAAAAVAVGAAAAATAAIVVAAAGCHCHCCCCSCWPPLPLSCSCLLLLLATTTATTIAASSGNAAQLSLRPACNARQNSAQLCLRSPPRVLAAAASTHFRESRAAATAPGPVAAAGASAAAAAVAAAGGAAGNLPRLCSHGHFARLGPVANPRPLVADVLSPRHPAVPPAQGGHRHRPPWARSPPTSGKGSSPSR